MSKAIILSEVVKQYLEELRQQGKSGRTLYTYGKDLEQVMAFFGADKLISSMTLTHVGKFYRSDELLKLPSGGERAIKTVSKTKRVFRMLMIWAQEQEYIDNLPLPKSTPMGFSLKQKAQKGL
jgi:hypothetical protein